LVTVFPQRGIEQGEHVCAIMFNAEICKCIVSFETII
jgi:hypothetical protein